MPITHINPDGMAANPAFTQVLTVTGPGTWVTVGGQNGVAADGTVPEGLHAQTVLALRNVLTALAAVGATQENVTRLGIYLVAGGDVNEGFAASREVWGDHATAITVLTVSALGRPGCLVEIEATAFVDA
jgi:2-iminobutanoate/2-iminopropanoate deaminase